jgi:hypothetical protein
MHDPNNVMVHISRYVKAGEERVLFTYYDELSPFNKRMEMSKDVGLSLYL